MWQPLSHLQRESWRPSDGVLLEARDGVPSLVAELALLQLRSLLAEGSQVSSASAVVVEEDVEYSEWLQDVDGARP